MKLDSMNLLLNLLGMEANYYLNKILLYKLGLEESFFITYLLDQFKILKNEGKLREDLSFYASNSSISIFTTISEFRISELKKSAINKEIIKISQEGIPTKTYYYIDFDKLLEIVSTDKSIMELAYEYAKINNYKNGIETSIESIEDIENLNKQSVKSLRFICKENNITYTGNDRKNILINKIIEAINPKLFSELNLSNNDFITVDEISSTSGQKNYPLEKNELLNDSSGQKKRPLVVSKTDTNQVLNKPILNTCHDMVMDEKFLKIEKVFKELDINFTNTNFDISKNILKKFNGNFEMLEEYIRDFYKKISNNIYGIKNLAALFSSRYKNIDEELISKIISKEIKKEEINKKIETREEEKQKTLASIEEIDSIISKFNSLSEDKKLEFQEKAEELFKIEKPEVDLDSIKNLGIIYYRILAPYLRKVLQGGSLC